MKSGVKMLALSILALTTATAPVRAADAPEAAVAIPAPPAGKGEVVFFRSGTIMGSAISCAVHENDAKVSSLPPGHYFVLPADPGKHSYSVQSEAKDVLNVQVESGEIQYVSCHVKMGIVAGRPVLSPATEAEFKKKSYKEVSADKGPAAAAPAPAVPADAAAPAAKPASN